MMNYYSRRVVIYITPVGCVRAANVHHSPDRGAADVLDACWESISGCKFVSVEHIGTRKEQWVFRQKRNWLAVFGVDAIEAIACDTT
jgi:hypothetical protein